MRMRDRIFLLTFVLTAVAGRTASAGVPPLAESRPAVETLFTRVIESGKQIVVTREPAGADALAGLDTPPANEHRTFFILRVEFRASGKAPVLLGSKLQTDYAGDFRTGLYVLNIFTGVDEVIVVVASTDEIGFWRIGLDLHRMNPDGWAWVSLPTGYQAFTPLHPNDVLVKLARKQAAPWKQEWKAVVTDNRFRHDVEFEQVEGYWAFKRVDATTREPAVAKIAIPKNIRDIKLHSYDGPMNPTLDDDRFQSVMAAAVPLAPDDPEIRGWPPSLWYDGSFTSNGGTYHFWLLWSNGGGKLLTPEGAVGFFKYSRLGIGDASTLRAKAVTRPAESAGPPKY